MGFEVTDRLLYNEAVFQLFLDFKKAYNSARREVLYNIFRVWGTHEPNWLKCVKVCMGKHLSDTFPIQGGLKQVGALLPLCINFASFIRHSIKSVQCRHKSFPNPYSSLL
jgi:hypothetical protein